MMRDQVGTMVVAVPVINEATEKGIVTALGLENIVLLGMTWGAWFQIGMFVALILLIAERALSIWHKLRGTK